MRRNSGQVPSNEEGIVGSEILTEVVQGCLKLWGTIGQQDHLALFRKAHHPPRVRGRAPRQQRGTIVTACQKKARSKLGGEPKHCSPSEMRHDATLRPAPARSPSLADAVRRRTGGRRSRGAIALT